MKQQLCIISHSHWDREWYLSHAKHNYRLVKLMDTLIKTLQTDDNYKSFHLDGQVIILNDYLNIRPEKKETILKLVKDGRLKIGPFYILQDEFLISGESNIRNILYGLKECKKYGAPSMTGYFPDAFGNIGQMPQILNGFDLDNAFFGRGIIPTGYANEVLGKSDEGFSEIIWEGVDGSKVIGVQFVNWYHNAYQISTKKEECLERLNDIIKNATLCARTPFLLGMNGCDHQPVQTDLSKVFEIAKELDVEVIHSNLEEYMQKIRSYKDSFYKFKGEIIGQNGTGFGTLIGTASSRIYLKQLNYKAQRLLANILEPLSVMADNYGIFYDKDIIDGCWKRLMENHPHDSICGCSVDSVHKKMEVRFMDVIDTAESLIEDIKIKFSEKIAMKAEKNIIVFNMDIDNSIQVVDCFVDYKETDEIPNKIAIENDYGEIIDSQIIDEGVVTKFILPDDRFREVFNVHRYKISFLSATKALSFSRYSVISGDVATNTQLVIKEKYMENENVEITFNNNGSFNIYDKSSKQIIVNQNYFVEIGDKGTEYEFVKDGSINTTIQEIAKIEICQESNVKIVMKVTVNLMQQNKEKTEITSIITLEKASKIVKINTSFYNLCPCHRIRAIFDCSYNSNIVYSEGQFDITKRNIKLSDKWKNENNPQRMSAFIVRKDEANGVILGVRGLNEYEVSTLTNASEITLVRSVGEMGDWFCFPTVDSQCKGNINVEYSITPFDEINYCREIKNVYNYYSNPLECIVSDNHNGEILKPDSYIEINTSGVVVMSCMKKAENSSNTILRLFNPDDNSSEIQFNKVVDIVNMAEDKILLKNVTKLVVEPKKIVTIKI